MSKISFLFFSSLFLAAHALSTPLSCNYAVLGFWDEGFLGEINITNTSDSALSDWRVDWYFQEYAPITQTFGARISQDINEFTASPLTPSTPLLPGESLSFSFEGTGDGTDIPLLAGDCKSTINGDFDKTIRLVPGQTAQVGEFHELSLVAADESAGILDVEIRNKDYGYQRLFVDNKKNSKVLARNTIIRVARAFNGKNVVLNLKRKVTLKPNVNEVFTLNQLDTASIDGGKLRLIRVVDDGRCDFFQTFCGESKEVELAFIWTNNKTERYFRLKSQSNPRAKIGRYIFSLQTGMTPTFGPAVPNPEPRIYNVPFKVRKVD